MNHHNHPGPKAIHLPCLLDVGYSLFRGETRSLAEEEGSVQITSLCFPGIKKPKHGDSAILTLELPGTHASDGLPRENLRILCKVSYLSNIIVGLQLNTQAFNDKQEKLYEAVLDITV